MRGRLTLHYIILFNLLTFNQMNELIFLNNNNDNNTNNYNKEEERERGR